MAKITLEQAKGFSLSMLKAVMRGRGNGLMLKRSQPSAAPTDIRKTL